MGEPRKSASHIEGDRKKVAVNLANGGGVGVGIVFIGGTLATAALVSALTVGRRLLKSSNSKNRNNCPSTGSAETPEKFIAENVSANKDESKGFLFCHPDSSPDMHQNSSNRAAKTSMIGTDTSCISSKSIFPEEKHNLELYSGKGDLNFDDKEILFSNGLHGSDSSMQGDGSVVKTEEFLLAVNKDQTLFQNATIREDPYGGEIEIIGEENTIKIPVDHSTEEESLLMQVNNDQKIRDVKCKEATETAEIDQNAAIRLQSSEEQESTLIDHDQDSNDTACLPSKSKVSVDQDYLVPLNNSSLCKDEKLKFDCDEGSQAFETVETLEGAEPVKAVHVEKGQDNCMILMEEKETKFDQREVWLITETAEPLKRDERLEAAHTDRGHEEEKICSQHDGSLIVQTVEVLKRDKKLDADEEVEGLLIVQTAEVLKGDDKLDADKADGGYSSTVTISGEEEKFDQHDGSLIGEDARGLEEDKALEAAQAKDEIEILMLEKEIGAPHDNESDAAGEAAKLVDAIAPVSSSDLQKQTEEQQNPPIDIQEDHCVSDMITSEKVTYESDGAKKPNLSLEAQGVSSQLERGSGLDSNYELLAEASEMREENISSEPASEESEDRVKKSDTHPVKQPIGNTLEEIEETPAITEVDNVGVTGQMEISEDDSTDDDTDEANITEKGEENSEGTGDSSVEYNTEPIWPAESLEELSMDLTGLKLEKQKEKQQAEETKTLQTKEKMYLDNAEVRGINVESLQNINEGKDSSKMTFLEKYMLELAEQNDQQTNSLKPRILHLIWLFMVLLWPLLFWYFGLPFLKISLIVLLVVLLPKIQGI